MYVLWSPGGILCIMHIHALYDTCFLYSAVNDYNWVMLETLCLSSHNGHPLVIREGEKQRLILVVNGFFLGPINIHKSLDDWSGTLERSLCNPVWPVTMSMFPADVPIPEAKLGVPGGMPWSCWPGMRRSVLMMHSNFWGWCCHFENRIIIWKFRRNFNICSSTLLENCRVICVFQVGMVEYVWFWRVTTVKSWGAQVWPTSCGNSPNSQPSPTFCRRSRNSSWCVIFHLR